MKAAGVNGLYGDADMARVMYGEHARHVPCWMYVQDQGPGTVALVGASMTPGQVHPLTYGGGHHERGQHGPGYFAHHFVVGEIIVRPHVVIGTNALLGEGLSGLVTNGPDTKRMLSDGAIVAGSDARLRAILERSERAPWRAS